MKRNIAYITTMMVLAFPALLFAWGNSCFYGWYGGPHMRYFRGGGFFMWIITIIVLAFVIFFGIRSFKMKSIDPGRKESPNDILKARYARGEITREQFDDMKKDLGNE
jgi:putative membrane protein